MERSEALLEPASIAASFRRLKPCVDTGLFYTIPMGLFEALRKQNLDFPKWDPHLWKTEAEMASVAAQSDGIVGFWNAEPIKHRLLLPLAPPSSLKDYAQREFAHDPAWRKVIAQLAAADELLVSVDRSSRGYCGWLMTNPTFVGEQECFLKKWAAQINTFGFPHLRPFPEKFAERLTDVRSVGESENAFASEYESFTTRWRIEALVAPNLPIPYQIKSPAVIPLTPEQIDRSGVAQYFLPVTMPVPNRDVARALLVDGRPGLTDEHLRDWAEVSTAGNSADRSFAAFTRRFVVQHYLRVLMHRWRPHLRGNTERLQQGFAIWLDQELTKNSDRVETMRKDWSVYHAARVTDFGSESVLALF